jgi:23S rRNA G2445 N2-methylase RlmL
VLNELGYVGNPDKRLLDPACGSGTFLVMAINRIRKWYDENRENCRFGEDDLCRRILANVVGFDLNPLAVMAARTNYLVVPEKVGFCIRMHEQARWFPSATATPQHFAKAKK